LRALLTEILAPSGLSRPLEEELYATLATRSQEKDYRQVSVIREELLALMTAGLEEIMPRKHDGRIKVYLGPTGTGKTTSLVKLAARYSWEKKLKVGLVTADTYRIAATEQLRIYAGIMGLPLLVARTAHDFQKSLAEFSSMDVIMVDTPGRNPRDTQELWKLQALLASGGETERNLVLSANVSLENLFQATEGYGIIGIDNVIFTKLDEGSRFGFLYDYLQTTRKAVSYLTDGQKVPEDIVPACAAKLARIICDGKLS
jgi:flagellar biosynthesis protein FlhF